VLSWAWWLTPVIPATWEAEIGELRFEFETSLVKKRSCLKEKARCGGAYL
jgi:hypothetical protein